MVRESEAQAITNALNEWRHWVGNDMLDHLDVADMEDVRDRSARFRKRLSSAPDPAIRMMLEFFELGPFSHQDEVWRTQGLKLFVSHVAEARTELSALVDELERMGVHCFLAHKDIKPAKNWRDVILESLDTMDALMSFHSPGFRASEWCAQEVGFALGRGRQVIALMHGEAPAGFIGAFQGVPWRPEDPRRTAKDIVESLATDSGCSLALSLPLSRNLKFSGSWNSAGFYTEQLTQCGQLSQKAKRNIELALLLNDQVRGNERTISLLEQHTLRDD